MHPAAKAFMGRFIDKHLKGEKNLRVLDVGSLDVNGSHREAFESIGHEYLGLDIVEGSNVDIALLGDPYDWSDLQLEAEFDVVVSSSAFEHIKFPEKTMKQIKSVLKDGGLCCIITPTTGGNHHPPDYIRFTVETLSELVGKELDILSCEVPPYGAGPTYWNDVMCIAMKVEKKKPKSSMSFME